MATAEHVGDAQAEAEHPSGMLDRLKQVVGLAPKEHRVDFEEHPTTYNAAFEQHEAKAAAPAPAAAKPGEAQRSGAGEEVGAQPSAATQGRVGARGAPQEAAAGATFTETEGQHAGTAPATPEMQPRRESEQLSAGVIRDLEARGFHRGRIEQGAPAPVGAGIETRPGMEAPVEHKEMKEFAVRPDEEVQVMGAVEAAEERAHAHAELAEEQRGRAQQKQEELEALRSQAKALEEQSAALVQEADRDTRRVEEGLQKREAIEHEEWRHYQEAARAEAARRAVVERAKPSARAAEEAETDAVLLSQTAADTEFHAQVLENRAKALLAESKEMAELSVDKTLQARKVSAQLMICRQEVEEMKQQIDLQATHGLPQYINECQREIGILSHRIAQLREEITWAEDEIQRAADEVDTWRRIVVAKDGQAAHLLLAVHQLQEDAVLARQRSRRAAEESREPTDLAARKYEEAWEIRQRAEQAKAVALQAQREALEVAKEAVGPEQERQRRLREAADQEAAAREVEGRVELVAGRAQRRLHEAEVKADTAAHMAEKAYDLQKEIGMTQETIEAEETMADTYRTP